MFNVNQLIYYNNNNNYNNYNYNYNYNNYNNNSLRAYNNNYNYNYYPIQSQVQQQIPQFRHYNNNYDFGNNSSNSNSNSNRAENEGNSRVFVGGRYHGVAYVQPDVTVQPERYYHYYNSTFYSSANNSIRQSSYRSNNGYANDRTSILDRPLPAEQQQQQQQFIASPITFRSFDKHYTNNSNNSINNASFTNFIKPYSQQQQEYQQQQKQERQIQPQQTTPQKQIQQQKQPEVQKTQQPLQQQQPLQPAQPVQPVQPVQQQQQPKATPELIPKQVVDDKLPTEIKNIQVTGGPYHTSPLKVIAECTGGTEGNSEINWYRIPPEGKGPEIALGVGKSYQPSCDDLYCQIRVEYTPVNTAGVRGVKRSVLAPNDYLRLDPVVGDKVEHNVQQGEATFQVQSLNHNNELRSLIASVKGLKIKKNSLSTSKVDYSDLKISLDGKTTNVFSLDFKKKQNEFFAVASHIERDILVITINSFLAMHMLAKEQSGLHAVKSLSKVRSLLS